VYPISDNPEQRTSTSFHRKQHLIVETVDGVFLITPAGENIEGFVLAPVGAGCCYRGGAFALGGLGEDGDGTEGPVYFQLAFEGGGDPGEGTKDGFGEVAYWYCGVSVRTEEGVEG
jgi:hypothetical protein